MKRIVFLIIASLMVIGFVLPGCTPAEENIIKIAVCGPLTDIQGQNHLAGAQMARDEINAAGGVTVNGTKYKIELVQVNTNEVLGLPAPAVANLLAVIDDVDFVVGGFRTEVVMAYRQVAMDAHRIFMNCGAATLRLQRSVNENYNTYKYWFKATPYNEIFLVTSMLKMVASAAGSLVSTLLTLIGGYGCNFTDPDYAFAAPPNTNLRVVIVAEALAWDAGIVTLAQAKLPTLLSKKGINMTVVGTYLWSDKANGIAIAADMAAIAGLKPHIIFTSFSGPVGKVYSKMRTDLGIPALSIGINVEGQQQGMVNYTSNGCLYDMMLDTYAWNLNETALTAPFFNAFWGNMTPNDYPTYTAATYDAIYGLKDAIEYTNSMDPVALIGRLETAQREVTGAPKTCVYPLAATYLGLIGTPPVNTWALNSSQVLQSYPFLNGLSVNGTTWGIVPGSENWSDILNWTYYPNLWTTSGGFCAHDTVYGPGYQTGLGTQWQNVSGTLRKMCWWPNVPSGVPGAPDPNNPNSIIPFLNQTTTATLWWYGVIDQYGYWAFAYPGTVAVQIPYWWWLTCP